MTVIDVFQTWQNLMTLVNVQQGGQIPPTVFNNWFNEVSDWYFKKLAEKYATDQILSDFLGPFTKYVNAIVAPQPGGYFGIAAYPPDYEFFLNATVLYQKEENTCFFNKKFPIIDGDGKYKQYDDPDITQLRIAYAGANVLESQINKVDLDKWASCLNHATKAPSLQAPKLLQFNQGFKVAPKFVQNMVLYYLKTPVKSVFAFTVGTGDIVVYNASGSTQLEWSEQVMPIFLAELQKKYAAYVNDSQMYQMGDNDKKQL